MGKSYRAEKYSGDGFRSNSNKGNFKFKKNNNNVHYTRNKFTKNCELQTSNGTVTNSSHASVDIY